MAVFLHLHENLHPSIGVHLGKGPVAVGHALKTAICYLHHSLSDQTYGADVVSLIKNDTFFFCLLDPHGFQQPLRRRFKIFLKLLSAFFIEPAQKRQSCCQAFFIHPFSPIVLFLR